MSKRWASASLRSCLRTMLSYLLGILETALPLAQVARLEDLFRGAGSDALGVWRGRGTRMHLFLRLLWRLRDFGRRKASWRPGLSR